MQNNSIQEAANELLHEARKSGDLLMKLRNEDGDFVKAKRAYVDTEEMRECTLLVGASSDTGKNSANSGLQRYDGVSTNRCRAQFKM